MIDIKHVTRKALDSRIHGQMRGFFTFLILSRVGLGGVLAGRYTDTNFGREPNISNKIERNGLRQLIL